MFIGREAELQQLNALYKAEKFQCAIIWGRRRVGKTTLINKFIKNKPAIYFTATESTAKDNLESFSQAIAFLQKQSLANAPIYKNFEEAFHAIYDLAKEQQLILVIDEYPYLAKAYKPISSILQKLIDTKFKDNSKLFIILCGSSMSFMEHQVLGYQSPLYGRRTAQLEIKPFNFYEFKAYYKNFSAEELAIIYGITGGIPQYMTFFNDKLSLKDNVINTFLIPGGYLYEEPENLLKQEMREPATYNAIIKAIATGASKSNEIASKAGLETSALANYMDKLLELDLIEKETPVGVKTNRKTIYSIKDTMFAFWYRFIPANNMLIQRHRGEFAWKNIKPQLNHYMGHIFEKICEDYFWQTYENLPVLYQQIGRWWGTNPKLKRQEEIDIVATDETNAIVAECKWRNELVELSVIQTLLDRAQLLPYQNYYYYVFSKTGFTEQCLTYARKHKNIKLYTYKDILQV